MSSRATTVKAQEMAKAMAKEIAKQMLAQSARLSPKRTPAQSAYTQSISGIAQIWQSDAMTEAQRAGWQSLADTLNAMEGRTGRKEYSAYDALVNIATACQSCGMDIPLDAPQAPAAPIALPDITLTASVTTGPTPSLTLTLHSDTYDGDIQVWAGTKTQISGKAVRTGTQTVLLGKIDGIVPLGVGIDGLWTSKLPVPRAGRQVYVKLVPVSATGFRGTPLMLTATVTSASAAAAPFQPKAV